MGQFEEYIESLRSENAKNIEKYNEAVETYEDSKSRVFERLKNTLNAANADDEPHRSHWIVAQCKMILSELAGMENTINTFEQNRKAIAAYDNEIAKESE